MAKFHVNPDTGNPGVCRSEHGKCPFGEGYHGDSIKAVEEIFAREMKEGTDYQTRVFRGGESLKGKVALEKNLSKEERLKRLEKLAVKGNDVPSMSFVSDQAVDLEKIEAVSSAITSTVPNAGLWTSRSTQGGSDWVASMEEFRSKAGVILTKQEVKPRSDAKLLKIDSFEDLKAAMVIYHGSERGFHGDSLDVKLLEEDGYEGIWLTRKGWLETRPHENDSFRGTYRYGQEEKTTHVEEERINTSGWIPSMVLFNKEAVGDLGTPELIHRDANGRDIKLMLIGQGAAAYKFQNFESFVEGQSNNQLKKLITKYRVVTKKLNEHQKEALEDFLKSAKKRGISDAELKASDDEARKKIEQKEREQVIAHARAKKSKRINRLTQELYLAEAKKRGFSGGLDWDLYREFEKKAIEKLGHWNEPDPEDF